MSDFQPQTELSTLDATASTWLTFAEAAEESG
jgi:hypothetical protein